MKVQPAHLSRWKRTSSLGKAIVLAALFFGLLGAVDIAFRFENLRHSPTLPLAAQVATGKVTLTNYAYLTSGLLYTQASELLGGPGVAVSARDSGGVHTAVYKWGGATMQALFENDRLVRKEEIGLK